jgi:hypothetical protein
MGKPVPSRWVASPIVDTARPRDMALSIDVRERHCRVALRLVPILVECVLIPITSHRPSKCSPPKFLYRFVKSPFDPGDCAVDRAVRDSRTRIQTPYAPVRYRMVSVGVAAPIDDDASGHGWSRQASCARHLFAVRVATRTISIRGGEVPVASSTVGGWRTLIRSGRHGDPSRRAFASAL